jgi:endonuclease/exonuclease/phosphatase (EEP) superfamily protein YafD
VSEFPRRSLPRRLLSPVGTLVRTAVVVGVLLHLTLRDAIPGVAVVYYALPRVVLAVMAFTIVIANLLQRRRHTAVLWLVVGIGIVAWSWMVDWRFHSSAEPADGIRVMYWNACRGYAGWDAVMNEIKTHKPDLVALGETEQHSSEFRAMWRSELPEYDISFLGGGMMCLVRGSSGDARPLRTDGYSEARELDVTIDNRQLRCLIVDVYAHPLYDRRSALTAIAALAEHSADRPLLILGDFNTPVDSLHFADLRRHHVNAFEHAGAGCIATWPSLAPVLSLDQIWGNPHLQVQTCRHVLTTASDHRPVVATVRLVPATPASRKTGN